MEGGYGNHWSGSVWDTISLLIIIIDKFMSCLAIQDYWVVTLKGILDVWFIWQLSILINKDNNKGVHRSLQKDGVDQQLQGADRKVVIRISCTGVVRGDWKGLSSAKGSWDLQTSLII